MKKHINWKLAGKSIIVTALICVSIAAAICALLASLVSNEILNLKTADNVVYGTVLLIVFIGAWLSARKAPCERLLVAVLTTAAMLTILLFLKMILLQDAPPAAMWRIATAAAMSLPAGLFASGRKGRRR